MICLSIVSDSPFTQEAIALKGHPGVVVHHYAGDEGCAIDDPAQLRKANPGIESGILHLEDLVRDARLAKKIGANEPFFRAHHLNQRQSPTKDLICTPTEWTRCVVEPRELPPREGEAWIGFDPGGSSSLTFGNLHNVGQWPHRVPCCTARRHPHSWSVVRCGWLRRALRSSCIEG